MDIWYMDHKPRNFEKEPFWPKKNYSWQTESFFSVGMFLSSTPTSWGKNGFSFALLSWSHRLDAKTNWNTVDSIWPNIQFHFAKPKPPQTLGKLTEGPWWTMMIFWCRCESKSIYSSKSSKTIVSFYTWTSSCLGLVMMASADWL